MMPSPALAPPGATVRVVAGLGCRRSCSEEDLLNLLTHSLEGHQLSLDNLTGLASVIHKQNETGLLALAQRLGLTLVCFTPEELLAYQVAEPGNALTLAVTGSPTVAEPSALALAARLGATPRLLGKKNRTASATCALATFDREPAA